MKGCVYMYESLYKAENYLMKKQSEKKIEQEKKQKNTHRTESFRGKVIYCFRVQATKLKVVVDVRNTYETRIGKFKGAVDPSTTAFREFPRWVDDQFELDKYVQESSNETESGEAKSMKLPRIAMYCTGGIRCEKASSFLLSKGFPEVYHLEGGILKYLEEVPRKESLWEGECFVFDKRVSVDHGLLQGSYKLCYGCKQPISDEDIESSEYEFGVSCPYCISTKSEEEKERARARQRQFETWGVIGGPDKGRKK